MKLAGECDFQVSGVQVEAFMCCVWPVICILCSIRTNIMSMLAFLRYTVEN